LHDGIVTIQQFPNWGNGRDVMQLWKDVYRCRATRLQEQQQAEVISTKSTAKKSTKKVILCVDVNAAVSQFIEKRRPIGRKTNNTNAVNTNDVVLKSSLNAGFPPHLPPSNATPQFQTQESTKTTQKESKQEPKETKKDENPISAKREEEENEGRDAGVSQAIWDELQRARKAHEEKMERLRQEGNQQKLKEEEERLRLVQARVRQLCPCPMGYAWFQVSGGWRCRGGSHFVTDAQLNQNFTK
jgi:hypothetical protein